MIGIRSAFSIRARGHRPHLEAVYMTAPRSVCRNTKKALPTGGRPYMTTSMGIRPRTTHTSAFSQRECARVVQEVRPRRAWGMPGADAPAASHANKKAYELVTTGKAGLPGIPARDGFTVSFVISPVIGLLVTVALLAQSLTPASRRQNHTTSPSAFGTVRQRCLQ